MNRHLVRGLFSAHMIELQGYEENSGGRLARAEIEYSKVICIDYCSVLLRTWSNNTEWNTQGC